MALTRTIISETAAFIDYEERDPDIGYYGITREWKPGSEGANRKALEAKLDEAAAFFAGNFANWPSLTNAQKDAANRAAQRALANLCRVAREQFDTPGT